MKTLVWFRHDLRLADNPALHQAVVAGECILLYIVDTTQTSKVGQAQRVWLAHSLSRLRESIEALGGHLTILKGVAETLLPQLCCQYGVDRVYWNRRYDTDGVKLDQKIKAALKQQGTGVTSYSSSAIALEPWEILNQQGSAYKVFTPYYKVVHKQLKSLHLPRPERLTHTIGLSHTQVAQPSDLLSGQHWADKIMQYWHCGEQAAKQRLEAFIDEQLLNYPSDRDLPGQSATSELSVHLRYGEISLSTIINRLSEVPDSDAKVVFIRQLLWREFAYYVLWHFPLLKHENFNKKFDHFAWQYDESLLQRWQQGNTGYPLVDAGMKELYETGYMHNRVRMVVGSFLTKHLLMDWRDGEQWFWETLLDGDVAVNPFSWQWVAGCGVDPVPYFRIFNPWLQAQKFDPQAQYIKRWVVALQDLPAKMIHQPDQMNKYYMEPIIEHQYARQRALDTFNKMKEKL